MKGVVGVGSDEHLVRYVCIVLEIIEGAALLQGMRHGDHVIDEGHWNGGRADSIGLTGNLELLLGGEPMEYFDLYLEGIR